MSFLVVGLGNPGKEYAATRHNAGYEVVSLLSQAMKSEWRPSRLAYAASFRLKGEEIQLICPTTYMNESGKAVAYWSRKLNIQPVKTLVVLDDIALPTGKLRLRKEGSDGGHNGLKSIDAALGTGGYPRLRVGIGGDFPKGMQSEYVLGKWSPEEKKVMAPALKRAADAVIAWVTVGLEKTMNTYNR